MQHLAVIMDGNGRYASARGKTRAEGHIAGAQALVRLTDDFAFLPLSVITVYAFSTENFKRSEQEVGALFDTIAFFLQEKIYPLATKRGIAVRFVGNSGALPEKVRAVMGAAPRSGDKTLLIALNYGGDDEVCRAVNKALQKGEEITVS